MKKPLAIAAAALLSATSMAYAAMAEWDSADADGDGKVTEAEFTAANPDNADKFDSVDKDGSGDISAEEYEEASKMGN